MKRFRMKRRMTKPSNYASMLNQTRIGAKNCVRVDSTSCQISALRQTYLMSISFNTMSGMIGHILSKLEFSRDKIHYIVLYAHLYSMLIADMSVSVKQKCRKITLTPGLRVVQVVELHYDFVSRTIQVSSVADKPANFETNLWLYTYIVPSWLHDILQ